MSIEVLNCQCCGAPLKITGSVCECEYCSSINIIGGAAANYINQLNRANKLRQQCEFDPAYNIYDTILSENTPSVDVLWSQALCEYGIEYVPDPVSSKYFPTLHRIKEISFLDSRCFTEAMELANDEQKEQLKKSAEEIERIQKEYLNIAANEKPYDVFICYKETDTKSGEMTEDTKLAEELYFELSNFGFKVFFARETLKDKLSVNYEPYIFAALKSARAMAVIGSKAEYFTSVWVKNEWGRFLKLTETHPEKKMFFACYNPEEMPRAFASKQAQLLGEDGAIKNLAANIVKFLAGNQTINPKNMKPRLTQEEFDRIIADKAKDYASKLYKTRYGETQIKLKKELSDLNDTARISSKIYDYSFHIGTVLLLSYALLHFPYATMRIHQYNQSSQIWNHGAWGIVLAVLLFGGITILILSLYALNLFNFKGSKIDNYALIPSSLIVLFAGSIGGLSLFAFFPVADTIALCAVPLIILIFGLMRGSNATFCANKRTFEKADSSHKTLTGLEEIAGKEFYEYETELLEEMKLQYFNIEADIKDYHYDEIKPSVDEQIKKDTNIFNNMQDFMLESKERIKKRNLITLIYCLSGLLLAAINIAYFLTSGAFENMHRFMY